MSSQELLTTERSTEIAEADFFRPIGPFDPKRFEMVSNWASAMAKASIIPAHLKGDTPEQTFGNCFLVANQAATWLADPVSVAQCTSLVHGKLCYEGKLIDSILQERYGIKLFARYEGDGEGLKIFLSPAEWNDDNTTDSKEIMEGDFERWHTKDKNGAPMPAWKNDPKGMLFNRGVRQWCRRWKPGVITGVYGEDEFDEDNARYRSERAKPVNQSNPFVDGKSKTAIQDQSKTQNQAAPADRAAGTSDAKPSASEKAAGTQSRPEAPAANRNLYEDLNKGLTHASNADSVKKVWNKFLKDNEGSNVNETDKALAFAIYGLHAKRFSAGLDLNDASTTAAERIEEAYA